MTAIVEFSTGVSTTLDDGTEVPAYSAPVTLQAQVQPLSNKDLRQIDGLNLQGTVNAIWFFGSVDAIERFSSKGGDKITFPGPVTGLPAGTVWLVNMVPESWADWCHTICTLQDE